MLEFTNCIVLHGPELAPHWCDRLTVTADTITHLELGSPCLSFDELSLNRGAQVIVPAFYNSHTHMGDSCLPDGATGMTLEQGFFRPHGYKYRELAKQSEAEHLRHITAHLTYMARTGTIGHIDFREQGAYGSELLRRASAETGVRSVVLGQFNELPFSDAQ
ncbi:MAG: amidohydrolase, partial [Cyanobacteria bacterium J069]